MFAIKIKRNEHRNTPVISFIFFFVVTLFLLKANAEFEANQG